ncbi:hypothetical protein BaRGS_00022680 [Batillaria attramentaria]|uniref:Uncharacterized protein n=1 Tax=Batillaria attramentaria TaxID=370345 RepID=A0ABD0KFV6_9CAEN
MLPSRSSTRIADQSRTCAKGLGGDSNGTRGRQPRDGRPPLLAQDGKSPRHNTSKMSTSKSCNSPSGKQQTLC